MLLPPSQIGAFQLKANESTPIFSHRGNRGGSGRSIKMFIEIIKNSKRNTKGNLFITYR